MARLATYLTAISLASALLPSNSEARQTANDKPIDSQVVTIVPGAHYKANGLHKFFFIFPGDFGIVGFSDFSRVWFEGESESGWHNRAGGGIYFAPLYRQFTLSLTAASSVDGLLLNGGMGFAF